jgi:hypothetical protein
MLIVELQDAEQELDLLLENMRKEMQKEVENEFGWLSGKIASKGSGPVLNRVANELERQGEVGLKYAEAYGDNPDIDEYLDDYLARSPLYRVYDGPNQEALIKDMESDMVLFGETIGPMFQTDANDFWTAAEKVYEKEKAKDEIENVLRQLEKYKTYLDGVPLPDIGRDRILGIIERGEDRFIDYVNGRIEQEFDSAGTQVN